MESNDTTRYANVMNATEFYQRRRKWAIALRIKELDVPAEVVWSFPGDQKPSEDEIRAAKSMVKRFYQER